MYEIILENFLLHVGTSENGIYNQLFDPGYQQSAPIGNIHFCFHDDVGKEIHQVAEDPKIDDAMITW